MRVMVRCVLGVKMLSQVALEVSGRAARLTLPSVLGKVIEHPRGGPTEGILSPVPMIAVVPCRSRLCQGFLFVKILWVLEGA